MQKKPKTTTTKPNICVILESPVSPDLRILMAIKSVFYGRRLRGGSDRFVASVHHFIHTCELGEHLFHSFFLCVSCTSSPDRWRAKRRGGNTPRAATTLTPLTVSWTETLERESVHACLCHSEVNSCVDVMRCVPVALLLQQTYFGSPP